MVHNLRRLMDILENKTDTELMSTLLAELAKSKNELVCAKADINKINGRINFLLVIANELISRQGD